MHPECESCDRGSRNGDVVTPISELIAEHWLAFMMAGPLILDEFLKWVSPKARAWLNDKFPPEKRRRFEIVALLLGVFLSGYLASEEHYERQ